MGTHVRPSSTHGHHAVTQTPLRAVESVFRVLYSLYNTSNIPFVEGSGIGVVNSCSTIGDDNFLQQTGEVRGFGLRSRYAVRLRILPIIARSRRHR